VDVEDESFQVVGTYTSWRWIGRRSFIDGFLITPRGASAIGSFKSEAIGSERKHIDIRYHFLRDLVQQGKASVAYIDIHQATAKVPIPQLAIWT
jgi:hypothetical protein